MLFFSQNETKSTRYSDQQNRIGYLELFVAADAKHPATPMRNSCPLCAFVSDIEFTLRLHKSSRCQQSLKKADMQRAIDLLR